MKWDFFIVKSFNVTFGVLKLVNCIGRDMFNVENSCRSGADEYVTSQNLKHGNNNILYNLPPPPVITLGFRPQITNFTVKYVLE